MRVDCQHGFFIFREDKVGEISDFVSLSGLSIVRFRDQFTFETLAAVPEYSIDGSQFLGALATKTYAGEPGELFEQNELVYDFSRDLVVPISTITQVVTIKQSGRRIVTNGLILPGSLTEDLDKITGYSGYFLRDSLRWIYSEVQFA